MSTSGYRYDAFISHAVEDKIPIANGLCERLEEAGLRIRYSGKELNAGDSINNTIDAGPRGFALWCSDIQSALYS